MRKSQRNSNRVAAGLLAACIALLVLPAGALAGSLDRFAEFLSGTQTARADFEQRITNREGKLVQESRGTFSLARPGRFRWTYAKPYAQLIVGDGARVWIYDEDLNQVTVRRLDQALGSTPAALLAGNNEVANAFELTDQGTRDGMEWLEARPRGKESSFEAIRMGFGVAGLQAMELKDAFGQSTVLRFTGYQRNPRLEPSLFRFAPPKGADVIGEGR